MITDDLRQRHLEAFFKAMRTRGVSAAEMTPAEYSGGVVRCAIDAGIIPGKKAEDVDEMKPAEVLQLTKAVNEAITTALEIPKNS